MVHQPGERVGGSGDADVLVGLGVAAGHDRERGDRLQRAQVLLGHATHLGEADRQRALELAVPHHRDADSGLDAAERLVRGLDLGLVGVGDERLAGRQHAPGDALAAAQDDAGPLRVDFVAGGGDAAARPVRQVDAGLCAAQGEVRFARERLEHLDELEGRAEGDRGAAQRGVALGAGGAALLGLQQGERGGCLVGERLGEGHRLGVEIARLVADEDGHVADLAAPAQRQVGHRGDVEALDEVLAHALGGAGVGDDQRLTGGDDPGDAGRALVEHLHVARDLGLPRRRRRWPARPRRPGRPRRGGPGRARGRRAARGRAHS